ncbi:MAG: serine acetyltransferase [Planctomycetota bacterium]|nr:MAG: serine acetyltransferase [Planctomycetota bacterium]
MRAEDQAQRLPKIVQAVVESYNRIGTINHLRPCPLPSTEEVIAITEDLKEVLYPGYRRRQNLHRQNVTYYVGDLLDSVCERLTQQIARALRHEAERDVDTPCQNTSPEDFLDLASEKTLAFLDRLPEIRRLLATDVQAAYDGDPAAKSTDEVIFCYPGLEAITVHRLAHELYRLNVPLIPRIMSERTHSRTGIDIHPGARIGASFFIDHGTGVVIGETCEIADNVKIYQGVTLGAVSFPKDEQGRIIRGQKRHPTIEENVVIYANATILGGQTVIGANSVIGASVSLMNESVPPGTVVTVEKPKLRFRESAKPKTA